MPFADNRFAMVVITSLDRPLALKTFAPSKRDLALLQRVKIEVDEQGATAVIAGRMLNGKDTDIHVIVDKPNLFALRDRRSGLILAAGHVANAPNVGE